jgi:hypothetical protein
MTRELKRYRVVVESAIAEEEGGGKMIVSIDGPGVRGATRVWERKLAALLEASLNAALTLEEGKP